MALQLVCMILMIYGRLHHNCNSVEGYGRFERVSDAVLRMVKKQLYDLLSYTSKCKELAFTKKGNA